MRGSKQLRTLPDLLMRVIHRPSKSIPQPLSGGDTGGTGDKAVNIGVRNVPGRSDVVGTLGTGLERFV
jgi:hypothetical protein